MVNFFSDVDIQKLSENQVKLCKENLTEKEAYVKNRHIDESGRLISDIIEIAKIKKYKAF